MTARASGSDMRDKRRRILILGGTGEARRLATRAARALPDDVEVISSYAGRTQRPTDPPGAIREGGFGGADGLAAYIRDSAIDLLVDATHPFAAAISENAATASEAAHCPRLVLRRPDWTLPENAEVTEAADMTEAAAAAARAERVFLTTGTRNLDAFAGLDDVWFLVRLIADPDGPLPLAGYAVTTGRPPFGLAAETALLQEHGIDALISKHSGGPLPAKIAAAAALGVPMVLIRQPAPPAGDQTGTIDGAIAWITERL